MLSRAGVENFDEEREAGFGGVKFRPHSDEYCHRPCGSCLFACVEDFNGPYECPSTVGS